MAIAFVQTANSGTPAGTATSKTAAYASAQTAGNLNIVAVSFGSASAPSFTLPSITVTDTTNNSYIPVSPMIQESGGGSGSVGSVIYYAPNIGSALAGANTVTVTSGTAMSFFIIAIFEYSGLATSNLMENFINQGQNAPAATAVVSGAITTINANDLIFGLAETFDGPTALGNGFTQRAKQYTLIAGDNIVSSTGTYGFSATSAGGAGWTSWVIAFSSVSNTVPAAPSSTSTEVLLWNRMTSSEGSALSLQDANTWTAWYKTLSGAYVQIDAGAAMTLTRVRLSPLAGGEDLLVGTTVKGSNDSTFATGVATILTVSTRPVSGTLLNEYLVSPGAAYRYYRFTSASSVTNSSGLADLDFIGLYTSGVVGIPCTPTLSPKQLNQDIAALFSLSCITSDATIYYTTDGSTPTTSSTKYTAPFVISSSSTLNAVAISAGGSTSRMMSYPIHIGNTEVSTDSLYDDRGYRVWAMNGSVFQDPISGWWYRFGGFVDTPAMYTFGFSGTPVYRSADLRNWYYRGTIMNAGTQDLNTSNQVWHIAVHMLYNASTGRYIAWSDSYNAVNGVFSWVGKIAWSSSSPEGPFTQARTLNSTSFSNAGATITDGEGDFSLFLDKDNVSAYLISTMGNSTVNNTLVICPLTSDYTNIASASSVVWNSFAGSATREAPWMIYYQGTYFLFHSGTVGFGSSGCNYSTGSSPTGPFSGSTLPFVSGIPGAPSNTISYDSQDWQILTIPGRSMGYMYMGDRYGSPNTAYAASNFPNLLRLRLPVVFTSNTAFTISWSAAWSFDSQMSTVSGAPKSAVNLSLSRSPAQITWSNNETYPASIYVDRANDANFTQSVQSNSVGTAASSFTDSTAGVGNYFYRIRRVNANGTTTSPAMRVGLARGGTFGEPAFVTVPAWEASVGANTYAIISPTTSTQIGNLKYLIYLTNGIVLGSYTEYANAVNAAQIDLPSRGGLGQLSFTPVSAWQASTGSTVYAVVSPSTQNTVSWPQSTWIGFCLSSSAGSYLVGSYSSYSAAVNAAINDYLSLST